MQQSKIDEASAIQDLRATVDAARSRWEEARRIAEDVGLANPDGTSGLRRALNEYAKASARYTKALLDRGSRTLAEFENDKPK